MPPVSSGHFLLVILSVAPLPLFMHVSLGFCGFLEVLLLIAFLQISGTHPRLANWTVYQDQHFHLPDCFFSSRNVQAPLVVLVSGCDLLHSNAKLHILLNEWI